MLFSVNALQDIQLSELTETQSITKERGTISRGLSMTGGDPPCASQSVLTSKPQAENLAPDDFCSPSTQLSHSSTVFANFQSKLKGKEVDLTNVGRPGVLLARCSYFGDDVLHGATLKGKGNRRGLDPQKLNSLFTEIHGHGFGNMTPEEFTAMIRPRIEQYLHDYLKPSRLVKNTCGSPGNY